MEQATLDLHPRRAPQPVSEDVVRAQPDLGAAIRLCVQVSARDPKGLYMDLEIDPATWSKILSGQAHFPHNKLERLMEECGNEIPLQWLAWRRGFGLVRLESEVERENRQLRELLDRERTERELVMGALRSVMGR